MSDPLHCLSVRQPWARLLVHGFKDVENRTWKTHYRGPLLIHASKKTDLMMCEYYSRANPEYGIPATGDLPLGAIVGAVDLVDCTQRITSGWHELGCWGWYVENPRVLSTPIPYRGQLGLYLVPADQIEGDLL